MLEIEYRNSRNLEAAGALDVHEERVGFRHNLLELVGAGVNVGGAVEKVNGESGLLGQQGRSFVVA